MRNRLKIVTLAAALMLAVNGYAQYLGSGTSAFAFLDLPVSSRLNALGGINVSVRDGEISMAMCNPALLGVMTDKVLELNYAYYLPGTMFGSALYGHNFGRSKIELHPDEPDKPNYFAAGIHFLSYGTMKYADSQGNLTGGTFLHTPVAFTEAERKDRPSVSRITVAIIASRFSITAPPSVKLP